jgi:hypothetical protein
LVADAARALLAVVASNRDQVAADFQAWFSELMDQTSSVWR